MILGGAETGDLNGDALALAGYPALALGYFKEPGLPQCLCSVPLEYFARASTGCAHSPWRATARSC